MCFNFDNWKFEQSIYSIAQREKRFFSQRLSIVCNFIQVKIPRGQAVLQVLLCFCTVS